MKTVTLPDFLTDAEIDAAYQLYRQCAKAGLAFAPKCAEFLAPKMPEVERKLGGPMVSLYLAYAIEYVFNVQCLADVRERK